MSILDQPFNKHLKIDKCLHFIAEVQVVMIVQGYREVYYNQCGFQQTFRTLDSPFIIDGVDRLLISSWL